jgi:hypothetical protein
MLVVLVALLLLSRSARAADDEKERFLADEQGLMTVLAGWSAASIGAGIPLWTSNDTLVRYTGIQYVAWGAVDGALATFGLVSAHRARAEVHPDEHWRDARATLRRIFLVNVALDVVYVAAGASLLHYGKSDSLRGSGAGILSQGGFLLTFDSAGTLVMGK